jgi:exonuclease SbcD
VNRAASLSAEDFSDDALESIEVLDDEEIFRRLMMSKLGITEANDEFNKDYEKYLSLYRLVVEEVNSEEA